MAQITGKKIGNSELFIAPEKSLGNQTMCTLLTHNQPQQSLERSCKSPEGIIQRLITPEEFQSKFQSRFRGELQRSAGAEIVELLSQYHEISTGFSDLLQTTLPLISLIEEIMDRCDQLLSDDDQAGLHAEIQNELETLQQIQQEIDLLNQTIGDYSYDPDSEESPDTQAEIIRKRFMADFIHENIAASMDAKSAYFLHIREMAAAELANQHKNETNIFTGYFRSDFSDISQDQAAPPELRSVLKEVLHQAAMVPVTDGPGSYTRFYKSGRGPNHAPSDIVTSVNQLNIVTKESSYLHEMTHVTVHEAYRNMPLAINTPGNASAEDYKRIYEERSRLALGLLHELSSEKDSGNSVFTQQQIDLLIEKTKYGMFENKLALTYIPRFVGFMDPQKDTEGISPEDAIQLLIKLQYAMGGTLQPNPHNDSSDGNRYELIRFLTNHLKIPMDEKRAEIIPPNLIKRLGLNKEPELFKTYIDPRETQDLRTASSIFSEYDTTVNQMLFLCYKWKIANDHPVMLRLRYMAQHAQRERLNAL